MVTFPYTSRHQRLQAFVQLAATSHLFTNDVMPTPRSVAANFSEPAATTGYQPITLRRTAWRLEAVGPAIRATTGPLRFAFTGERTLIRGHYALDRHGQLIWSELFTDAHGRPQPVEILRADDAIEILLMIDAIDLDADVDEQPADEVGARG